MSTSPHVYHYRSPSEVRATSGRPVLSLSTSGLDEDLEARPHFFDGRLLSPRKTADLLLAISSIVRSRFHTPAGSLARIVTDPVITSSLGQLRFEGFSSCCGAYARLDLSSEAMGCSWQHSGTTNVDFNPAMRAALARLGDSESIGLAVGSEEFVLERPQGRVTENRVELPGRWLRGFAEVQAIQATMEEQFDIRGPAIKKFLAALPRNARSGWLVPHGSSVRLAQVLHRDGVFVAGLERLNVLQRIGHHARALRIYGSREESTSAFILDCVDSTFSLVLSPSVWRGFSGEGQLLYSLAQDPDPRLLAELKKTLSWDRAVSTEVFAAEHGEADASKALGHLAVEGVVGFDLAKREWFKRLLPFGRQDIGALNPRIKGARELLDAGRVKRVSSMTSGSVFEVRSSTTAHRVKVGEGGDRCTCPWFVKHRGERGPCKHVLAAHMALARSGP